MHTEIPICKRCCFCLPLRYGLLFWGYLKLAIIALMSIMLGFDFVHLVKYRMEFRRNVVGELLLVGALLLINVSQIVITIVFIVGGHRKNAKLLKMYYINNIIIWILLIIMISVFVGLEINNLTQIFAYGMPTYTFWYVLVTISMGLIFIIMEAYLLILLRSEIVKLRGNCQFRFTNNVSEGQCILYLPTNNDAVGRTDAENMNRISEVEQ